MEEKKYELTDEFIKVEGHVLYRIKALKNFSNIVKGELGGFIEDECNLSHEGDCWVYNNAKVYQNARVFDDAMVCNEAQVHGRAIVYGNARICDNAEVFDNAQVYNDAWVFNDAKVRDYSIIADTVCVYGNAKVNGHTAVFGTSLITDNAETYGHVLIKDNVKICGNAKIKCDACIRGQAIIEDNKDYIEFTKWWGSKCHFIWTRSNNMWCIGTNCYTSEKLLENANKEDRKEYERLIKYVEEIYNEKTQQRGYSSWVTFLN